MSKFLHLVILAIAVVTFVPAGFAAEPTPTATPVPATAPVSATDTATPVVVSAQSEKIPTTIKNYSIEKKFGLGLSILGAYEYSNYESLYVDFQTSGIQAAGAGFASFIEYGFTDRISGSLQLGYSRVLHMNKFLTVSNRNFFVGDLMGNYYFVNNGRVMPYLTFGAGVMATSGSVAPTANVGGGMRYQINEDFSIRGELLLKTAIIHQRGEARLGFSYHF